MLYGLIRAIIFIVIVLGFAFYLKKKKTTVRKMIVSLCATLIFSTIITSVPFENIFGFSSAEKAYNYYSTGEIVSSADNEDSSAILYRKKGNTYSVFYTKKDGEKHKICTSFDTTKVKSERMNDFTVSVTKIKGTDDYYLFVMGVSDSEISIVDNTFTHFEPKYVEFGKKKIVVCLVNISYFDGYSLQVNGETFF